MRYSRMKEQNIHVKESAPGRAGGVIFILILAAAVVYILAATKAGDVLSEKVIVPAVEFFTGKTAEPVAEAESVFSGQELVTEEFVLPEISEYLLQSGVFSEPENAESAAKELETIGGAGYIRPEGEQYRVIISGYSTKDDATNVKERLESDRDMQTKLIELTAPELTCTIRSNAEQIETVKGILGEISDTHVNLLNSALELDKGNLTAEDALSILADYKASVKTSLDTITSLSEKTDDPLVAALRQYFETVDKAVADDETELSGAALSSALKRAYIGSTYAYYDLLGYDTND